MSDKDQAETMNITIVGQTAEIVAALCSRTEMTGEQVTSMIDTVYKSLSGLGKEPIEKPALVPAVPIKKSRTPEHLVCLECGKKYKMLKRHLQTEHNFTIPEYRNRWGLPTTYSLTADDYSAKRTKLAKKIGLGRSPKDREPLSNETADNADTEKAAE